MGIIIIVLLTKVFLHDSVIRQQFRKIEPNTLANINFDRIIYKRTK